MSTVKSETNVSTSEARGPASPTVRSISPFRHFTSAEWGKLRADTPRAGARPQGEDADGAAPADVGGAAGPAADADARVLGVVGRAFAPGSGTGRHATLPAWLVVGGDGAPHHAAGAAAATPAHSCLVQRARPRRRRPC